jgi:hypothetical protein
LLVVLLALASVAQAAVYSLPWGPKPQFVDANGAPMSNGTLSTFLATSSTRRSPTPIRGRGREPDHDHAQHARRDAERGVAHRRRGVQARPEGLGGRDRMDGRQRHRASTTPPSVGRVEVRADADLRFGDVFTLVGDQTTTFTVGRRLKTTNSGGTVYSTITASVFAAVTTVTVVNDSSSLDAGLSAVALRHHDCAVALWASRRW